MKYLLALLITLSLLVPTSAFAAVAYQSHSVSAFANSSSVTITKPTGLTAGDFMYAVINTDTSTTLTSPGGSWTLLENFDASASTGGRMWTYYKVADAGDVAASNFTFTLGVAGVSSGVIFRVNGQSTTAPVNTSDTSQLTNAASAIGATNNQRLGQNSTTASVNDTLVIVVSAFGSAITVSNLANGGLPTMGEDFDQNTTLGSDWTFTGHHGSLGTAASFGNVNSSYTQSASSQGSSVAVIAIAPPAAAVIDSSYTVFFE